MAVSSGIMMAGSTVSGAITQGEAARAQGDYQRSQSYINASIAEKQADDAIDRGSQEAGAAKREEKKLLARQQVTLAAQGVDVDSAGAQEILQSTQKISAVQEMNIKTNAWREAWGFKSAAVNDRTTGDVASIAGKATQRQTLISGGMQAVGYGAGAFKGGAKPKETSTQTRTHNFGDGPQYATNRFD
jgi:hypothetical protein